MNRGRDGEDGLSNQLEADGHIAETIKRQKSWWGNVMQMGMLKIVKAWRLQVTSCAKFHGVLCGAQFFADLD